MGWGEVVTGVSARDLCRIFIFEMLEQQRATHRELYKVYFNGMFMIYLFIFWREREKNRNISIKCHNWTYFYYWDLKVYECQCDLMWTNLHSSLNEQLINSDEMLFFPETLLKNHWNELKINEKSDINAVSVCCSTTALTVCPSEIYHQNKWLM